MAAAGDVAVDACPSETSEAGRASQVWPEVPSSILCLFSERVTWFRTFLPSFHGTL